MSGLVSLLHILLLIGFIVESFAQCRRLDKERKASGRHG